jgi:hypothetical protein
MRGMRAPVAMEKAISSPPPSTSNDPTPRRESQLNFGAATFVGKVPVPAPPEVQFAGVSDGQSLWALPKVASPEGNSEGNNSGPGSVYEAPKGPMAGQDDLMADIDWVSSVLRFCFGGERGLGMDLD